MTTAAFEVVILNDYASLTGGSTAVALASALGLAARGIPVTLFTCVGPIAPALRQVPNLEVICLGQSEIAKQRNRLGALVGGWRNGRAVRDLRQLLADRSPRRTIVHAHTWTKALSPCALATVADLGFPLVVTLHDFFIVCPNGGFFVYPTHTLCGRVPLSRSCWGCRCDRRSHVQKLWRNVRTVLQNRVWRVPSKVSHYIGVSDFSLNLMRRYLPSATPMTVVRHPVDCVPGPPAPVAANRAFLFIGRFEVEKGVRLFAFAVQATGVEAIFIGDGALGPEIRRLCPQAHFPGWLGPEEIRRHLRQARALVFPPLWYETLGLVVIEAAAAGVPAIISDECAATDHIEDGGNGLHFSRGSVVSLAEKITTLARNPAHAGRLGEAAHEWYWRDPWTSDRHVEELIEIYRGLLPRNRPEFIPEEPYASARRH